MKWTTRDKRLYQLVGHGHVLCSVRRLDCTTDWEIILFGRLMRIVSTGCVVEDVLYAAQQLVADELEKWKTELSSPLDVRTYSS